MFFEFLNIRKKCEHKKLSHLSTSAYCPDCGEMVETHWYLCRCACCGIKRKGILKFGKIVPEEKYCTNCGTHRFIVEKYDNLDFSNVQYAVLKKEVVYTAKINLSIVQTWIGTNANNYRKQVLIGVTK